MARRTFYFRDFICPDDHTTHKFVESGTEAVMCEYPGCVLAALRPKALANLSAAVHGDELDYIDHNLGPKPIHIRSHSQRRALMAAAGLEEMIRHTPVPGTDKSPHTIRWVTMDPQTMENARILVERQGGIRHVEPADAPPDPVANPFRMVANNSDMAKVTEVLNTPCRPR